MADRRFGKYTLLAELGHGGMADVFLSVVAGPVGSGFSKLTVIKRLRKNLAEEPEFVAMLVDEARIAGRLNHPNVVQTNEVGEVDGQYFIAMEFLDGQPLHRIQHRLSKDKEKQYTVTREMQLLAMVDTLAGLHHAHELKDYDGTPLAIVHRDVTPHNIFVTYEGQVKVVDFGIARAVGRSSETREGIVKGKVRYMAPEQAMGAALDRRADVFAVGVMVWEIAAGRRMWKDMDDMDILHSLVSGNIPSSPRAVNPEVPEEIDRICQRALAARAEDRYATAADLRADLESFLASQGKLVEARRGFGVAVTKMFTDKRDELRGIIEHELSRIQKQAASPSATTSSPGVPAVPQMSSPSIPAAASSPSSGRMPTTNRPTVAGNVGADSITATPTMRSPVRAGGRWARVGIVAGAVAMATALAFTIGGVRRGAGASAAPPPAPSHEIAAATDAPEDIEVSLVAHPANAVIDLDEHEVGAAFKGRVPRDDRAHRIEVRADGFLPHAETVTFEHDISREFALQAAPAQKGTAGGTASTAARGHLAALRSKAAPPAETAAPVAAPPAPKAAPAEAPTRKSRRIDENDPWNASGSNP